MSLLIERAPSPMVSGKRLFDKGNEYQAPTNIPKFKRCRVDSVRNFPRYCGPLSTKNEQGSSDFIGAAAAAAVAATPLRIELPNHEKGSGIDGPEEGAPMTFNSAPKKLNDDDLGGLMKSGCEAFKIPKSGMGSSFENSYSGKMKMKDSVESKGKSIRVDDDDGDDDDCVIIGEKSSNILHQKIMDANQCVLGSVIPKGEVSKTYEFEWVEVIEGVEDDISFFPPSKWENLAHNQSDNGTEPSNKKGAEYLAGVRKQEKQERKVNEMENMSIGLYDAATEIGTPDKVQEVLNLYKELCTNLSLEEGKVLNRGTRRKQVYVKAAMILKKGNKWINTKQTFGHVPGVEIGDMFRFRAELVIIGLHHEFICGINCVTMGGEVYAISVVDSGRYENKAQSANVLIYSGQGGNPRFYTKLEDQKLEGGNLALKNSMDAKFPVRVVRKIRVEAKNFMYMYDGLYNVNTFWPERSEAGKMVYMFEMVRMPSQHDCDHHLTISKPRKSIKHLKDGRGVIGNDLSQGKEKVKIMVVNDVNDEKPQPFTYITEMVFTCLHHRSIPIGCGCIGGCSDSRQCSCLTKNRRQIPFNEDGAILRARKMVYECGPNCRCPSSCQNRVSQHGPQIPLEVFRTKSTGWGVRSPVAIQSGSFICEYIGELLKDEVADQRANDEYLFDLDDGEGYTIDAAKYGNVSRFINHSCSPNLYAQDVLYDYDDKKLPHVMLFATENIPPLEELTYHYNYKVGRVCDSNGNIKKKKCCCGSRTCSGRLY